MPDEASTPPADPPPQQATDGQSTQAPPSEPVSAPVIEPTPPPPPAAAPAPETPPTKTPASAEVSESMPEPVPEPQTQSEPAQSSSPTPQATQSVASAPSIVRELLSRARAKIQERRRKKLERIMTKLSETGKISNNEVQKLLRVSDATATRYLDLLEKEGKIRQEGKTGKYVVYVRVGNSSLRFERFGYDRRMKKRNMSASPMQTGEKWRFF